MKSSAQNLLAFSFRLSLPECHRYEDSQRHLDGGGKLAVSRKIGVSLRKGIFSAM